MKSQTLQQHKLSVLDAAFVGGLRVGDCNYYTHLPQSPHQVSCYGSSIDSACATKYIPHVVGSYSMYHIIVSDHNYWQEKNFIF